MANFFKSTAFKCVTVLVCLMIVLGGALAVLNSLWSVSPEERTSRAIKKIYGTEVSYVTLLDIDSQVEGVNKTAIEYTDLGKINKIYKIGDDLLFQATGEKGYKNGTITVWVKVINQNDSYKIDKVILESYDKQTLMSQLKGSYYDNFLVDVTTAYENGQAFTTEKGKGEFSNPVSGATKSATAGNNAVNCVIKYLGVDYEK